MAKKHGIPKEIIEQLDIKKQEPYKVSIIIEHHQARIPIPRAIREDLNLKKGQKAIIFYDEENKKIICEIQNVH